MLFLHVICHVQHDMHHYLKLIFGQEIWTRLWFQSRTEALSAVFPAAAAMSMTIALISTAWNRDRFSRLFKKFQTIHDEREQFASNSANDGTNVFLVGSPNGL